MDFRNLHGMIIAECVGMKTALMTSPPGNEIIMSHCAMRCTCSAIGMPCHPYSETCAPNSLFSMAVSAPPLSMKARLSATDMFFCMIEMRTGKWPHGRGVAA